MSIFYDIQTKNWLGNLNVGTDSIIEIDSSIITNLNFRMVIFFATFDQFWSVSISKF